MSIWHTVIRWQSAADFLVVALVIYLLLRWGKEARALRISVIILFLRFAATLARQLNMTITAWMLDLMNVFALLALVILFHPELRNAVLRLDIVDWFLPRNAPVGPGHLRTISDAVFSLAQARRGALIVMARRDPLSDLVSGGVPLGGEISGEILEAIFRKVSPVHDGAVIIEGDHISRVGTILPLTERSNVPQHYGTRHRAAMGLAERSDAVILVVSEERGEVSLVYDRAMDLATNQDHLVRAMSRFWEQPRKSRWARFRQILFSDLRLRAAAVGLTALLWLITFIPIGTAVRTANVPVVLVNVPRSLELAQQSAATVEVRLRGNEWLFASSGVSSLEARFDVHDKTAGTYRLEVKPNLAELPFGITIESVNPDVVSVRLVQR
jgi:diadenylate cyclase